MGLPRRRTLWLSAALLLVVVVCIARAFIPTSPVRANWTVWDAMQCHVKQGAEKIGVKWE
jgi:hypothetical protein